MLVVVPTHAAGMLPRAIGLPQESAARAPSWGLAESEGRASLRGPSRARYHLAPALPLVFLETPEERRKIPAGLLVQIHPMLPHLRNDWVVSHGYSPISSSGVHTTGGV